MNVDAAWLKGDAKPRDGWSEFVATYRDDCGPGHKWFDDFRIEAATHEDAERLATSSPDRPRLSGELWGVKP